MNAQRLVYILLIAPGLLPPRYWRVYLFVDIFICHELKHKPKSLHTT